MPNKPEDSPPHKGGMLFVVIVSAVITACAMLAIGALWLIQSLH
jgi:hypothetical protein